MGKKKKHKKKKYKFKERYQTRRDMLLSQYSPDLLDLWFGDDQEKINHFGDFLVEQYELERANPLDSLKNSDDDYYKRKIRKVRNKECESINDVLLNLYTINLLKHEKKKDKKRMKKIRNRDLSLATYTNCKKYRKSYLNNDDYRKALKKIAKQEKDDIETMRKLGYIRSKDCDAELEKLLRNNTAVQNCISDAYVQKHFLK